MSDMKCPEITLITAEREKLSVLFQVRSDSFPGRLRHDQTAPSRAAGKVARLLEFPVDEFEPAHSDGIPGSSTRLAVEDQELVVVVVDRKQEFITAAMA